MYAGSATMGMACMSLGLTYYGVEQNIDVVEAAEMRLGALYEHRVYTKQLDDYNFTKIIIMCL